MCGHVLAVVTGHGWRTKVGVHLLVVAAWAWMAVPTASCCGCGRCSSSGVWRCPDVSPNQLVAMEMESSWTLCKHNYIYDK